VQLTRWMVSGAWLSAPPWSRNPHGVAGESRRSITSNSAYWWPIMLRPAPTVAATSCRYIAADPDKLRTHKRSARRLKLRSGTYVLAGVVCYGSTRCGTPTGRRRGLLYTTLPLVRGPCYFSKMLNTPTNKPLPWHGRNKTHIDWADPWTVAVASRRRFFCRLSATADKMVG